jgi:Pyridoxamine 5'-phosphate oxidase
MGTVASSISPALREWIARQHVFFVGTAPSGDDGHINVSPKGLDTFRVLGPTRVVYLDLTGSGVETIAHLRDNGRITVMFCAFEGPPRIVRLYGRGHSVEAGDPSFDEASLGIEKYPGARSCVIVDVERVADSCGYAVPLMSFAGDRDRLIEWAERKGDDGLVAYRAEKNATSIDGLPGLPGVGAEVAP